MRQVVYVRKNNNIIEINSKRYNATTGDLLEHAESTKPSHKKKSVEGVHRPTRVAAQAPSHHPAPPKTLMRHVVKKPAAGSRPKLKAQGQVVTSPTKSPLSEITVNSTVQHMDDKRLHHAKQVHKSQLISRFGATVRPSTELATSGRAEATKNHAAADATHKPAGHHKSHKTRGDIFEQAIQNATSHKQPRLKHPRHSQVKRGVGIGGAVVLAIVALGAITAQNLPNAKLQMASAKAGFDASLPEYRPAGFSLGKLDYSEGAVATQFTSNSDDRRYTITQKRSSWDSAALRDIFVAPSYSNYQTIESGGRTIYIYGQRNATWVNGGVWYQIQSNDALSDHQLVDIASSL